VDVEGRVEAGGTFRRGLQIGAFGRGEWEVSPENHKFNAFTEPWFGVE